MGCNLGIFKVSEIYSASEEFDVLNYPKDHTDNQRSFIIVRLLNVSLPDRYLYRYLNRYL